MQANLETLGKLQRKLNITVPMAEIEGEVEMHTNHALEDYEVRAGYVLSCQSFPLTDKVVVTYDE